MATPAATTVTERKPANASNTPSTATAVSNAAPGGVAVPPVSRNTTAARSTPTAGRISAPVPNIARIDDPSTAIRASIGEYRANLTGNARIAPSNRLVPGKRQDWDRSPTPPTVATFARLPDPTLPILPPPTAPPSAS